MTPRYPRFDPSRVRLRPLSARKSDLSGDFILPLRPPLAPPHEAIQHTADAMEKARRSDSSIIWMCGGHVIRAGVQRFLFDLMRRGFVSCIAVNGSVAIHDYEIALQMATTESVATYVRNGQFGLWEETGRINDIIARAVPEGLGFGEALGRELAEGNYPYKDFSLFATAWKLGIPVTVHVGIGYDIIHAHPNVDGAALGLASYRDFLIYTRLLTNLEGGVVCTFGSAVMAPEVFLKALSMVRNVASQQQREIAHFTSLVCDLVPLPAHVRQEAEKNDPHYYFRPWKTLLSRTVADGGESFYVCGPHHATIPELWAVLINNNNYLREPHD